MSQHKNSNQTQNDPNTIRPIEETRIPIISQADCFSVPEEPTSNPVPTDVRNQTTGPLFSQYWGLQILNLRICGDP